MCCQKSRWYEVLVLVAALAFAPALAAAQAESGGDTEESMIKKGFEIAPVPLNLAGKNRALVGLGSYIVNAVSDCNACHNPGPGNNQFAPGGNPYFGQPKKIDPAKYLGGGRDFGPLPGSVPQGTVSAHIICRNLTPDKTGLPVGGATFEDFVRIIRTGADLDCVVDGNCVHPTCNDTLYPSCVPTPFDGTLLQIMPWFNFQDMTDHDLQAIYEYLSAIPCLPGPSDLPSYLQNVCQ